MARVSSRHITHILCLISLQFCEIVNGNYPVFHSLTIINESVSGNSNFDDGNSGNVVEFQVRGRNIFKGMQIRTTLDIIQNDTLCKSNRNYKISELWSNSTTANYLITIPNGASENVLYLCLPRKSEYDSNFYEWINQGERASIKLKDLQLYNNQENQFIKESGRNRRDDSVLFKKPKVSGLRLEASAGQLNLDSNGVPEVLANANHSIRLFGSDFTKDMQIVFTNFPGEIGGSCQLPASDIFSVDQKLFREDTVVVNVNLPIQKQNRMFYICIKHGESDGIQNVFIHQGSAHWLGIKTYEKLIPIWAAILIICVCLTFSALFSGLNLGLMSLDRTELKILCNTGSPNEKKYAKVIQPVRNHGNYLLCSILLGNVFVNSIFTILLDDLTSGLIAVVFSTLSIVMFGEITPQAICSRHGLAVGAKTIYITKFVMLVTFPLSYPISKLLDVILGEEIGNVYNRERLKELVKVTTGENDLDKDEVNIISGALELRKKTVADVMTRIEDVFMLDYEAILDFETVSEIMKSGFSRIPVFETNRENIVTMLYIKDLAFVDPDDNTPLKTLCQFYQNPCNFVFEDVTLDVMFRIFKEGNKGHMAFVHRVNSEGEGDPFYETIGLITLEDVIEELIQAEIMDETDVFTDNRSKRRRNADRTKQDFTVFAERRGENNRIRISPQLTLATYQYLSTSVEAFNPSTISETILRRLLKQDIIHHIKKNKDWRNDQSTIIYQQGKAVDYFVLILEGRVEVTVGKENLMFESGPFTYFGTQALVQNVGVADSPSIAPSTLGSLESLNLDALLRHTFQPDYTVRACTDVLYMRVKRSLYLAAKRATLMERSQRDNTPGDQFDDEVEKLLHSLEEDDTSMGRRTPRRSSSKNLSSQHRDGTVTTVSLNTSPKASLYSNVSPPHRISPREINGDIKVTSTMMDDDCNQKKEEESLLLNKKL